MANEDKVFFAKTNFRNLERTFGIKSKDRHQHLYVIGKTGTGKTNLLRNLVIQDIQSGQGLCLIDPHGEFVESLLEKIPPSRVNDVIYFNPVDVDYPIGFNVLEVFDPQYKHLVSSDLMGIFTKIWANVWSARMEYIMQNCVLALLDTPGTTLLGIPRLLVDKDYRQKIISNVKDPVVKSFWVHEYETWRDQFRNEAIVPIQNKVGQFLSTGMIRNIVGQPKSTINIAEIMNTRKILLVNVSKGRIGEDNSALLGAMLITKIQLAAMERVRIAEGERRDFYLYVDEFQNFATDSFASILSEARKYHLHLIIAHQYIGQLVTDVSTRVRDAVFGNVGTMIAFRVGADDAEFLEKEFEPEFTIQDLVNLPNYQIVLKMMVDGVTCRPFSAVTLPPLSTEVYDQEREKIISVSRERYARPRDQVEEKIRRWSGMSEEDDNVRAPLPAKNAKWEKVKDRPANNDDRPKFEVTCSVCGRPDAVPFKPDPNRPIYCSDCLKKVRSGEIAAPTAVAGRERKREAERAQETKHSPATSDLSGLGIEFEPVRGGGERKNKT
ncbi:MAG: type IV secretion system DNA-binding domain-containing protein, partial [Candidatus Sungbacteria bacterium]|nr:type IV secretion system DNA-binding domain-containing protein [Candidatus Sungbacteria bacterium]